MIDENECQPIGALDLTICDPQQRHLCTVPAAAVVSGARDGILKLWALAVTEGAHRGTCVQIMAGHAGDVHAVASLGTDCVASGGDDGAFKVHTLVPAPLFLDEDAELE